MASVKDPTNSRAISKLLFVMILSMTLLPKRMCSRILYYNLREELPRGTFVGNVKDDSNITAHVPFDQVHRLRFEFRYPSSIPYRYFIIDEQKGVIRTGQVIDREGICLHSPSCDLELDVKVKPVEYFQVFKVVIRIEDVNDNLPTFPSERVEIGIMETTQPGSLFLVSTAMDADSGSLGVQEYQLMTDTDVFELKVTDYVDGSKDIRLKLIEKLDREREEGYTMTVLAIDGGRPRKTGSVILDITVLDSNDNNPRFDNASYGVTIYENLPEGSLVVTIRATDPDYGQSGVVTYSFADYTERDFGKIFRIDDRTGEIYLKGLVDYETSTSFQLTVIATDLGTGSLPAFAKVTVDILDLNDNPPEITINTLTESGMAEVRENSEPGSFVAHAAAKDIDGGQGGEISCSIDGRGLFRLESLYDSEYKLVTSVSFDREQGASYTLILTCRDNGVPSLTSTAQIKIAILDENDHSPQFSADTITGEIPENSPPGYHILNVNASDADAGKNAALLYRLRPLNGTPENCVEIDSMTGAVKASRAFDYEARTEYRFLVTVFDHGDVRKSATATLLLYVKDVNDENPVFAQQSYQFTAVENQPIGTGIGKVTASDKDVTEDFRKLNYKIDYTEDIPFEINSNTGEIYNSRSVDRELSSAYRFSVVAYNPGFPDSDTRCNITLDVADVNDHNPMFLFPSREKDSVEISSSAGIGALVTRVMATDSDEGKNAEITYSISNGNIDGLFDIHPTTGVLILAKELEQADVSRLYKLVVVAKDGGDKPLMGVSDLRIIANATSQSRPTKTSAAFLTSESFLTSSQFVIIVGAVSGLILVILCLVLAVVCVKRHNRRVREKLIDQMLAAGSPCSHHYQSPACSSRGLSRVGRPDGSLTTVDTCSLRSGNQSGMGQYRLHPCGDHRGSTLPCGDYRGSRVDEDDEGSDVVDPWSHREARIIANSHIGGSDSIIPGGTPPSYRGIARYAHRPRSRSPRPPGPGARGARSCSNCSCASCQGVRGVHTSQGNGSAHHHRHRGVRSNGSRHQSPEYIPMHVRGSSRPRPDYGLAGCEGGDGPQDSGSLCSWPDSGRGPSEEDDAQKLQLDPLLKGRSSCCSQKCHHQHHSTSPTGTL